MQVAIPIYHQLVERGEGCEKAAMHIHAALDYLAMGCHRFRKREKAAAYREARDAASLAGIELLLRNDSVEISLLDLIEKELMPSLAGLIRSVGRRAG